MVPLYSAKRILPSFLSSSSTPSISSTICRSSSNGIRFIHVTKNNSSRNQIQNARIGCAGLVPHRPINTNPLLFYSLPNNPRLIIFRCFSFSSHRSRRRGEGPKSKKSSGFKLDALPFSISPETALDKFHKWAVDEQGLHYLLRWNTVRIGATYVPVWSFDVNFRFVTIDAGTGKKNYKWKPSIFSSVYDDTHPVIHLPGLASYAGYSYRRSLINPVVNSTLLFMGDQTVPFGKWMLADMELSNGEKLEVVPDVWNSTRGQAFQSVSEDFQKLAELEMEGKRHVKVQSQIVSSRRVYLPLYFIDYSILGIDYRVFASGCDSAADISGMSHQVFSYSRQDKQNVKAASLSFLAQLSNAAHGVSRVMGPRGMWSALAIALQFVGSLAARLLIRIPVIGFFGGLFVGFRKVIQPWMNDQRATAEWERQRDHEAYMEEDEFQFGDDFVDNGAAERYFAQNRERILSVLGGSATHEQGDFDWYNDWEEWARQQWTNQQTQQQQHTYHQQNQRQQTYQQKSKPEYQWDFDVNDPYSVLGIRPGATLKEVSVAFRREMLKHHPDTQAGASEAQKARSVERSKLITEAYRKIKTSLKR